GALSAGIASDGGGGLVSVGKATSSTSTTTDTTLTIENTAQLLATGNIRVSAGASLSTNVQAAGSGGGGIKTVHSDASGSFKHTTKTDIEGTLTAGGDITVGSQTNINGISFTESDGGGFGVGSSASS